MAKEDIAGRKFNALIDLQVSSLLLLMVILPVKYS